MTLLRRLRTAILAWVVLGVSVAAAPAQSTIEIELDGAKALYREGRLQESIIALQTVVLKLNQQRELQNRTSQLTDAYFHLGLAHLAMRNEAGAVESFRQVLALDPARTLDPEIYAPRVISMFDQARSEVPAARSRPNAPPPSETAVTSLPAVAAATRSASDLGLLPGTKLRVVRTGTDTHLQGYVIALNDRVLTVGDREWRVDVPRDTITRVDVVGRVRSRWLMGMLIGTAVGILVGAAEEPGCDMSGDCYTRGENIAYGALGAGLLGTLIGAFVKTEEWVELPLQRQPQSTVSRLGPPPVGWIWRF